MLPETVSPGGSGGLRGPPGPRVVVETYEPIVHLYYARARAVLFSWVLTTFLVNPGICLNPKSG